jgi:hypothetical protein
VTNASPTTISGAESPPSATASGKTTTTSAGTKTGATSTSTAAANTAGGLLDGSMVAAKAGLSLMGVLAGLAYVFA